MKVSALVVAELGEPVVKLGGTFDPPDFDDIVGDFRIQKGQMRTENLILQGPAATGSFAANPFGLHEVHGNVSEWVQDCSNQAVQCSRRVLKGGSFVDQAPSSRAAWRYVLSPRQSRNYLGFRVARDY